MATRTAVAAGPPEHDKPPAEVVAETPDAPAGTAEDLRSAQVREYGQWVADGPIFEGGARAYNDGDPVPASNVERLGYDRDGRVRRVDAPQ